MRVNRELQLTRTPACHGPIHLTQNTQKSQPWATFLTSNLITPTTLLPPLPDSHPSPSSALNQLWQAWAALATLPNWLAGQAGGGRDVWRGRVGVKERGQGCFLFSRLIDSQMSAVGFAVLLKHSGTLFPSKSKNNTYTCTKAQPAYTCGIMLCFCRPHLH